MYSKQHHFEVDGHKLTFSVSSGTVLDTDQRSDTHVSGSGTMFIYNGTGSGESHVSSEVEVNRDIWLQGDDGKERHMRFNWDLPVRKGQRLTKVSLSGSGLFSQKIDMSILNQNTQDWWWIQGNKFISKPDKKFSYGRIVGISMLLGSLAALLGGMLVIHALVIGGVLGAFAGVVIWLLFFRTNAKMDKKIREEHNKLIKLCVDC